MVLPSTKEQFFLEIEYYNIAIWPLQWVLYMLGVWAIVLGLRKSTQSDRIISSILAILWLWMGIFYHFAIISAINKTAFLFCVLFVLQALLFLHRGVLSDQLSFRVHLDKQGGAGAILLIFALPIYPWLAYLQGRRYPSIPTFGVPSPTTIFTFGLLLWSNRRLPLILLVIPLFWSIVGAALALRLGVHEDFAMLVSGLLTSGMLLLQERKRAKVSTKEVA